MEKLEGKLVEVIAAIEKAAPAVWDTLLFQARLEGAIALAFFAASVFATWRGVQLCRVPNRYHETFNRPLVLLPVTTAIVAVFACPVAVTHLVNPEYQAICDLIRALN